MTLAAKGSTKRESRARYTALSAGEDGGSKCEGWASTMSRAMAADSMMLVPVVRDSGDETFLLTVSSLRMLSHSSSC
jgi:hypothetical protein